MHYIDWIIVLCPLVLVAYIGIKSQKYVKRLIKSEIPVVALEFPCFPPISPPASSPVYKLAILPDGALTLRVGRGHAGRQRDSAPRSLDLDTDARRFRKYVQLLDPNPGVRHPGVMQTHVGDAFREGFDQVDVPSRNDRLDPRDDVLVAHDLVQPVRQRQLALGDGKIDVDAHALAVRALVGVNADLGAEFEIAHEQAPERRVGIGHAEPSEFFRCAHQRSCPLSPSVDTLRVLPSDGRQTNILRR